MNRHVEVLRDAIKNLAKVVSENSFAEKVKRECRETIEILEQDLARADTAEWENEMGNDL